MHIGLKLEVSTQEIYFVTFVNNETVLNISYFYASLVGSLLHSLLQRENSYCSPRSPRLITDGAHVNVISAGGLPRIFSGFPFVFSHIFLYHVLFSFDVLIFFLYIGLLFTIILPIFLKHLSSHTIFLQHYNKQNLWKPTLQREGLLHLKFVSAVIQTGLAEAFETSH